MPMNYQDQGESDIGLPANIAALLAYLLGIVSGVVFLVIEKNNKFVRFHAMQSVIVFGVILIASIVLMFIPIIGWILNSIIGIIALILWIVLMLKAYQGDWIKLPVIGDIAEKKS
jgi:uncharacterized membrane protein